MYDEIFRKRLTELREKHGVSARDMSLSIGQNPGYINNIENGKALPSMSGFFYICEYLGITPKEFFDTDTRDPKRLAQITRDMKSLTDEELSGIAAIVKGLVK